MDNYEGEKYSGYAQIIINSSTCTYIDCIMHMVKHILYNKTRFSRIGGGKKHNESDCALYNTCTHASWQYKH